MQAKAVVGPARFVDGTHTAARDVWGLGKVLEANAVWLRTAGLREFCQMSMLPVDPTRHTRTKDKMILQMVKPHVKILWHPCYSWKALHIPYPVRD